MGNIIVLPLNAKAPKNIDLEVAPISRDREYRSLSPFYLGPCYTRGGVRFENMENLWQYSKVYGNQVDSFGIPNDEWHEWHKKGAVSTKASRYPMGKGAVPLFSAHGDMHLSYITARKLIYIPQYASLVQLEPKFRKLHRAYQKGANILIRDYDAYDLDKEYRLDPHEEQIRKCINNSKKKMGHGFVLAWTLMFHSEDPFWYKGLVL